MLRGSEEQISNKTSKKGLTNIQKSIAALLHLAAAAMRRVIAAHGTYHILDLFGLSEFKGGNAPLPPPDKYIPVHGGGGPEVNPDRYLI